MVRGGEEGVSAAQSIDKEREPIEIVLNPGNSRSASEPSVCRASRGSVLTLIHSTTGVGCDE